MHKLLEVLQNRKIFKLVLGLGNQSYEEIKNLVKIYASAGCDMFDINASDEAVSAVHEGLKEAGVFDSMICMSVGVEGDTHTFKAEINPKKCVKCGRCAEKCPQDAIIIENGFYKVLSEKCIGCKRCKCGAISYCGAGSDLENAVLLSKKYNLDCVELHVSTKKPPIKEIKYLLESLKCPLSLCLDRKFYSNEKAKKLIKKVIKLNGSSEFIIQADGVPMSGGEDDFNSTLQAVAMAHLVQEFGTYIFISGGTNSKTAQLAKQCNVHYNGISVGSYARKIVKNLPFEEALSAAKNLVNLCKTP